MNFKAKKLKGVFDVDWYFDNRSNWDPNADTVKPDYKLLNDNFSVSNIFFAILLITIQAVEEEIASGDPQCIFVENDRIFIGCNDNHNGFVEIRDSTVSTS